MAGINSIPELVMLYSILDLYFPGRLEREGDIHEAILYKRNREETGDPQEAIFDPIGQTLVNSQMGYWCYTPLFYDGNGRPIRKVPVGRGSWNLRNTDTKDSSNGVRWCIRKLKYENTLGFKMIQFSLGDRDEQPGYAICQIFPLRGRAQQPARGPPGNLNKRRRLEIQDPSDRTRWPIENDHMAETLTTLVKLLLSQRTLQIRDPSDGSEWTIDNGKIIEFLRVFRSDPDQSTGEIRQSNAAPPNTRIEDHQSTTQVQASQHGAAGTPNESAMHRDPSLSHESYMPTQERLHTNNQVEQGLLPDGTSEQFQAPQPGTAGVVNDISAMLHDQNLSYPTYGKENQWNAHIIDPFYAPGESSTHYNQGFNDDDFNTSDLGFD